MQKIKILLVEDDEATRNYYRYIISQLFQYPHEIIEATSGQEALQAFFNKKLDCIILDYQLPDFNGIEVLKTIKKTHKNTPPIIFLTASGDEKIAVDAMKAGAVDYLVKQSLEPNEFIEKINSILKNLLSNKLDKQPIKKFAINATAIITFITAILVLIGWFTNNSYLVQMVPDLPPMQINTAVCFLILGISLLLYDTTPKLATIGSLIVLIISSLTLVEHVFAINLGLDNFIISPFIKSSVFPNRMAPNTALYFILVSLSILNFRPIQSKKILDFAFSLFVTLASFISLLGYFIQLPSLYTWGDWGQMAVVTAFLFFIIGLNLSIFFWVKYEIKKYTGHVLLPLIVIVLGGLIFIISWQEIVNQTHRWFQVFSIIGGLIITIFFAFTIHILQIVKNKTIELKNSEEKFQIVLNNTSDAILVVSKDGNIVLFNNAFLRLSQYSELEMVHTLLISLFPNGTHNKLSDPASLVIGMTPQEINDRYLCTKHGEKIPVDIQISPIELNHEHYFLYSITDIRKNKNFEKELMRQTQLMHLMLDATVILEEKNLNVALKNILVTLCVNLKWPIGHIYILQQIENEDILVPSNIWHIDTDRDIEEFKQDTMKHSFARSVSLPGRVLAAGRTMWCTDLHNDNNFHRKQVCINLSINSCVAFPIKINKKAMYIFEFFDFKKTREDSDTTLTFNVLGEFIGNLFERRQSREERETAELNLQKSNEELKKLAAVSEQQKTQLEYYAYHDSLTTILLNRRGLEEEASRILAEDVKLAFLFVDIDNFKKINDALGHRAGDIVLIEVSKKLKSFLSEDDIIGRMGGDEFGILLFNANSHKHAVEVAEKIIAASTEPISIQQQNIKISVSIGISYRSAKTADLSTLLKHADTALLKAKQLGRNRYEIYGS